MPASFLSVGPGRVGSFFGPKKVAKGSRLDHEKTGGKCGEKRMEKLPTRSAFQDARENTRQLPEKRDSAARSRACSVTTAERGKRWRSNGKSAILRAHFA
jgi:hypothetical protein